MDTEKIQALGGLELDEEDLSLCSYGGILDDHGSAEQKSSLLEPAIAGNMQLALAYAEPQSRFNLSDVVTEAICIASWIKFSLKL